MKIKLTFTDSKNFLEQKKRLNISFIHVIPTTSKSILNELVELYDYANNLLGRYYIASVTTFRLDEVTPTISYLDKNVPPNVYITMKTSVYQYYDHFDALVLTTIKTKSYD